MSNLVLDIKEVTAFIRKQSPETKIYLGSDSSRFKKNGLWFAEYTTCIVVHMNGRNGCKVFGESVVERDYDQRKDRPSMRLMNEVTKLANLFHRLEPVLKNFYVELHVDLNRNKKHGSSCVVEQALGYLKGVCPGIVVEPKPFAPAASFCADRLMEIMQSPGYTVESLLVTP